MEQNHHCPWSIPALYLALLVCCFPALSDGVHFDKSQWQFVKSFLYHGNQSVSSLDCRSFSGVVCDGHGMITNLSLPSAPISGPIPESVGSLRNLVSLDLSMTSITGPIPSSIGNLTKLQKLYLYQTQINGSIPDSIGRLVNLVELDLSLTLLSGPIPSSIGNVTQLQILLVYNTQINGSIPDSIGRLVNLVYLGMYTTSLSGSIPSSIGNLTQLKYLYLDVTQINGSIPESIGRLVNLVSLQLGNSSLSGPIPSSIGNLTQLQVLTCSHSQLNGSIPESIGRLASLFYLQLSSNRLQGAIPKSLSNLIGLKLLYLENNRIEGVIPTSIGTFANLRDLNLGYNHFSGTIPESFSSLQNLEILSINHNQLTGYIPDSLWTLPNAQELDLDDNFFTGTQPVAPASLQMTNFTFNCWSNVPPSLWNPLCSSFCEATINPNGACNGNGRCFLNEPQNNTPTCACFKGFRLNPSNKFSCEFVLRHPLGFVPSKTRTLSPFFNARFSRLLSYNFDSRSGKWLIGNSADWRLGTQGMRDQGSNCSSSWAIAPLSAFEILSYIVANSGADRLPLFSEGQVMLCGKTGNVNASSEKVNSQINAACADGGWPEAALDFIAGQDGKLIKRKGAGKSETTFVGRTNTANLCNASLSSPSIPMSRAVGGVMFERIDFFGWFGVLLALQQQPVVVLLHGSHPTFQLYTEGIYSDLTCFGSVTSSSSPSSAAAFLLDHVVLLVGYELKSLTPYWIVRNSWGTGWGEQGDMRLAIMGGAGVCGVHSEPALYPVISGFDPCSNPINPCGGGDCIPIFPSRNGNAKTKSLVIRNWCRCPGDEFVNVTNVDGTQTCGIKHVCSSLLFNPCGSGTCVDDMKGGYSCICPPQYEIAERLDSGEETCMRVNKEKWDAHKQHYYVVTNPHVTCALLYSTFGLTKRQFLKQNPNIRCGNLLIHSVVRSTPDPLYACSLYYPWNSGDNCSSVSAAFGFTPSAFLAMNPGISGCSFNSMKTLIPGQQVCISQSIRNLPRPYCSLYHELRDGESCETVQKEFHLSPQRFLSLNPGISCHNLSPPKRAHTQFSSPISQVCIAGRTILPTKCPFGAKTYALKSTDSCLALEYFLFKGKRHSFSALNGGFPCFDGKLTVGVHICIP